MQVLSPSGLPRRACRECAWQATGVGAFFQLDESFLFPLFVVFDGACCSTVVRFVLCGLDTCVWPSNASYVANCINSFTSLLAMSPSHGGHCQTPVMQSQTSTEAWVKHRRTLEDLLKKARMDITTPIALTFDKSSAHSNDKRSVNHACLFVSCVDHQQGNAWESSAAVAKGVIGPCALIRVSDMQGFDPDNRFGPAARTEQPFDQRLTTSCVC